MTGVTITDATGCVEMGRGLSLGLGPVAGAPAAARALVDHACDTWGLRGLLQSALLVVSELVGNAVEHAGTDVQLEVFAHDGGLLITVRDGDPRLPDLPDLPDDSERGRGLRLVAMSTTAWGVTPLPDGKVVWAFVGP